MTTDDVSIIGAGDRADHRTALTRVWGAPVNREMMLGARSRMGSQANMVGAV